MKSETEKQKLVRKVICAIASTGTGREFLKEYADKERARRAKKAELLKRLNLA